MRAGSFLVLCAALALASGCDCAGDTGGVPDGSVSGDATIIVGLRALRLEPVEATITIEGTTPATQQYRAIGTFQDGRERDVTEEVTFRTVGATHVGSFRGGLFTSTTTNGGRVQVQAQANGQTAMGVLTVVLHQTVDVPPTGGGAPLPTDPGGRFGGADDAARAPTLVYPNDGVVLPPNLGRVEVHWLRGPATNTLFEVAFTNDVTDVRAYVRCERPAGVRDDGCIWEPSGSVWTWIAETNRGGSPLAVRVRATDDAGSGVGSSDSIDVRFARDPLQGTLYYWTTTSGGRIMRYDFGAVAGEAERVMGPEQTESGSCVGCHSISRDGRKLLGTVGGQNRGGVLMYDLESYQPLWNESDGDDHVLQFTSFSPDSNTLVGVYGDDDARSAMGLLLYDVTCDGAGGCGTQLGAIPTNGFEASHPSWSPETGQWIAYTEVGNDDSTSQRPIHGAIAMVTRDGTAWSAPSALVPRVPGISRYNPDWAPDESFLVYNEATCPGGDVLHMHCNADSDPSAKVWAVVRSTGATVRMDRLSAPGVMDEGRTELNDTFPRMAPFVFVLNSGDVGDTSLMYVSFASTRAYGLRNAPGGNEESGGRGTYLWMAGVLPESVELGEDPSFAAFALPFQDLTTSNHIAVWTTEAIGEPGPI